MPEELTPVQRAFSKQAEHFDQDDLSNKILIDWRKKIYSHVEKFLKPGSEILELNAGTGIDASWFVSRGYSVHATEFAPGMIAKIREKALNSGASQRFTVQACSFENLNEVKERKFDFVFSNFGGLNCCEDLVHVTRHLQILLKPGAHITWVIMPPVCPWELASSLIARGSAFRRLKKGGTSANLEGEIFTTYYYSMSKIKKVFGPDFTLLKSQGLGIFSPPPANQEFVNKHPLIHSLLKRIDSSVGTLFPFNRWGDHFILTFRYKSKES